MTEMLPSFHDYLLTGYAVDGEQGTLCFTLRWPYDEIAVAIQRATITFKGVSAYRFEHDLGQNILLDIEEFPLAQCLNEQAAFFDAQRRWGWPRFWQHGHEAALATLTQQGVRAFAISPSYGMSGWILARSAHHQVLPKQPHA